jgi:type IV pilus assembly protein PilM
MLREPFTVNEEGVDQITKADIKEKLDGMMLVDTVSINEYYVTATFKCPREDQPSQYVRALIDQGYFENITYSGYEVTYKEDKNTSGATNNNLKGEDEKYVKFELSMQLKAGNDVDYTDDEVNSSLASDDAAAAQ